MTVGRVEGWVDTWVDSRGPLIKEVILDAILVDGDTLPVLKPFCTMTKTSFVDFPSTGSLLKQEQRPDRVPGEPNPWFDLGVFMAFKQAYFQRS